MIVTLREDIPKLGKKNERVKVSDAYARNVLIPRKMAFVGEQTLFHIEPTQNKANISHKKLLDLLTAPFLFSGKANENGGLYKKITAKDIATQVSKRSGLPSSIVHIGKDFESISRVGDSERLVSIDNYTYKISLTVQNK